MKTAIGITALLTFLCLTPSLAAQSWPRFKDYEVPLYKSAIHRPKWIRHVKGDEWRDDLNKLVDPPEVNFAGKYFVAGHSCGTGCRYYTMTDLASGRELVRPEVPARAASGRPSSSATPSVSPTDSRQ